MQKETVGILGIDNGGSSTCVVTKNHYEWFPSVKSLYGERTLTVPKGNKDYVIEYKNEKYIGGFLAKYDSAMPLQFHSESKQNLFFDLSILIAIHQFGYLDNYVVTCCPVSMHNDSEKLGIRNRLVGSHTIKVNGITRTFRISDLKVVPEGAAAFWTFEPAKISRFLDIGSRTVNFVSVMNENGVTRYLDTQSGTFFGQGIEALDGNYNPKGLADFLAGRLFAKKWKSDDEQIYVLGGGANDDLLVESLREHFPHINVLDDPVMANAKGLYVLAKHAYQMN